MPENTLPMNDYHRAIWYNRLEGNLHQLDASKRAGTNHPSRMDEPIGEHGKGATFKPTPRFLSTSNRNKQSLILTPEKHLELLCPHDGYDWQRIFGGKEPIEQTKEGDIIRYWKNNVLHEEELRAQLLDNGEQHDYNYWTTTHPNTQEGKQRWRAPSIEQFIDIAATLLVLSKTSYAPQVNRILNGNPQNNTPGLRQKISRWVVFADHIQYGKDLSATITNPYGKNEETTIPTYDDNHLVLAREQHEKLLGTQTTPDNDSWLEALVGNNWAQLPQILQFLAPRHNKQAPANFGNQTENHLREARIWTPNEESRNDHPGRVASLYFNDVDGVGLEVVRVYGGCCALGVRDVK